VDCKVDLGVLGVSLIDDAPRSGARGPIPFPSPFTIAFSHDYQFAFFPLSCNLFSKRSKGKIFQYHSMLHFLIVIMLRVCQPGV